MTHTDVLEEIPYDALEFSLPIKINPSRNALEYIFNCGANNYKIEWNVLGTIPKNLRFFQLSFQEPFSDNSLEVHLFKFDHFGDFKLLASEYQKRGLKPAHPAVVAVLNKTYRGLYSRFPTYTFWDIRRGRQNLLGYLKSVLHPRRWKRGIMACGFSHYGNNTGTKLYIGRDVAECKLVTTSTRYFVGVPSYL